MKVVAIRNCTISGLGAYKVGDEIQTDKDFGEKLIARKIAKKYTKPVVKKKEASLESEE